MSLCHQQPFNFLTIKAMAQIWLKPETVVTLCYNIMPSIEKLAQYSFDNLAFVFRLFCLSLESTEGKGKGFRGHGHS